MDGVGEALSRFDRVRVPTGGDPLVPMRRLLGALGDPHLSCPACVHIAGTNGKGSVAALARSVSEAAGLSVHVFTSPHLVRPNERIRIAGRLITDSELLLALEEILATGEEVTFFEAFAAAAFLWFSRRSADLAIVEVGAGGSYDATNVLPDTDVSVITAIGRDHEAMFGVCGEVEIARVKAGIMRSGRPVVIARQSHQVREVFVECAGRAGAIPKVFDTHWRCSDDGDGVVFSAPGIGIGPVAIALAGRHQVDNAGAALAALTCVLSKELVCSGSKGLSGSIWPGRLQTLCSGPLTECVRGRVVLDGAHNESGARVLAEHIAGSGVSTAVVMAIGAAKPAEEIISALAGCVSGMVFCALPDAGQEAPRQGLDPRLLVRIARGQGVQTCCADGLLDAVVAASGWADDVYICGSLYLVGEALRLNHDLPD